MLDTAKTAENHDGERPAAQTTTTHEQKIGRGGSVRSIEEAEARGLTPWQPGQSGNPAGRPKGSRNKVAQDFFDDLHTAWNKVGPDGKKQGLATIEAAMKTKPADVVKAMVAVVPKELDVTFRDASDAEIQRRLDSLLGSIGLRIPPAASNVTDIEAEPSNTED